MMETQNGVQRFAQEAARSTAEQVLKKSDATWEKFPEPRGWALKWHGFALSEIREQKKRHAPLPNVESR